MDEQSFTYEGQSGPWLCTIYLRKSAESTFSAVGDIAFQGKQRCKLVTCRTDLSIEAGVDLLKQRCIGWIEQTERRQKLPLATAVSNPSTLTSLSSKT